MVGLIAQPVPGGAMVLLGVTAAALIGALTPAQALAGYADPSVWMVFCAFHIARHDQDRSGPADRAPLHPRHRPHLARPRLRAGRHRRPARHLHPVGQRPHRRHPLPHHQEPGRAYGSTPGPTADRLGAFLLPPVYHCEVVVCAMFLTGQASNPLIASFARQATGDRSHLRAPGLSAPIVPGLLSLIVCPWCSTGLSTGDQTDARGAAFAQRELERLVR